MLYELSVVGDAGIFLAADFRLGPQPMLQIPAVGPPFLLPKRVGSLADRFLSTVWHLCSPRTLSSEIPVKRIAHQGRTAL
jgi:hypothetical protein